VIRTVVIDDEPKNIKILKNMLQEFCPGVLLTGEATNGQAGKKLILEKKPQLVFLDIEMPYGNGFDLLNELMPIDFEVIFITAFDKYLLQALKYSALDFLLKPVNIEELKNAVRNAEAHIQKNSINQQLQVLLDNFKKQEASLKKIAVPTLDGFDFIHVSDIVRCESQGPYTKIYLSNTYPVISSKPLKDYESLLPEELFFRIHNSNIINLNHIKKYNRGRGGFVELDDGSVLEVAARRKEELFKRFGFR
jgi:two-component system LytT family response regulator